MQCFMRYIPYLFITLLFSEIILIKFISAVRIESETGNELIKIRHRKKFQTKIVFPTVSGLRCKHLRQHCRFSQDCCPGTYCYEDEGDSHKRHCDV
ncbi:hypothetical protein AVEN_41788-1 [Araneus ventricosus]|uniref:Uncharacterized protein n=1 Tax=Araneus ventricosus TaxID=182803 RepID=A0A4Y2ABY9_ARAVE|nr:hypothetical protein AVEN_41788-1 [Araneus ventricosus]